MDSEWGSQSTINSSAFPELVSLKPTNGLGCSGKLILNISMRNHCFRAANVNGITASSQ